MSRLPATRFAPMCTVTPVASGGPTSARGEHSSVIALDSDMCPRLASQVGTAHAQRRRGIAWHVHALRAPRRNKAPIDEKRWRHPLVKFPLSLRVVSMNTRVQVPSIGIALSFLLYRESPYT
ncbi:hypothetical protein [Xanthomonas arboricola]|uniref:hypothetical protein n=1 Tax=Xanthomonas arboricola TaxID=56448 RepID=UPI0015E0A2B8|nr:hypothetical protein [Xanthomonas arboricola]